MIEPPLTAATSWTLKPGPGGSSPVLRAGQALWVAGAVFTLTWLWGVARDLRQAGLPQEWPWLGVASVMTLVWMLAGWRTWSDWARPSPALTLSWLGPVTAKTSAMPRHQAMPAHQADRQTGGFHVEQWGVAVDARIVLDLQRWMLIRLESQAKTRPFGATRRAWAWLDTRALPFETLADQTRGSLHQLRTLLCLPDTLKAAPPHVSDRPASLAGKARAAAMPVASCADSSRPETDLRRATSSAKGSVRLSASRSSNERSGRDTLFPETEFLGFDPRHPDEPQHERGRP